MRILLVEDEKPVASALTARLQRHGYDVVVAKTAGSAVRLLDDMIDVVLLDLGLPGQDGLRLCPYIRSASDAAILMVSARDAPEARIQGLNLGADDYIVKPYDTRELLARMNAVLRRRPRRAQAAEPRGPVRISGVEVDVGRRTICVGDRPVDLTKCEFDLLALLAAEPGVVVSYDRLAHELWRSTWPGFARALHVHVARIRAKLGQIHLIQTVRGVGYRLPEA